MTGLQKIRKVRRGVAMLGELGHEPPWTTGQLALASGLPLRTTREVLYAMNLYGEVELVNEAARRKTWRPAPATEGGGDDGE